MSLSAALLCRYCFLLQNLLRLCWLGGLCTMLHCSHRRVQRRTEPKSIVLEQKMGSLRIQTDRTLQGGCCQAEQLAPVQLWQTDRILSLHVEETQPHCHGGVLPTSLLTKPRWTTSTVLFFFLAFLVGCSHNSEL